MSGSFLRKNTAGFTEGGRWVVVAVKARLKTQVSYCSPSGVTLSPWAVFVPLFCCGVWVAGGVTRLSVWIGNQFYCSIWHQQYGLRREAFRFQITPCFGGSYDSSAGSSTLNHSSSDQRSCFFVVLEENPSWSYFNFNALSSSDGK